MYSLITRLYRRRYEERGDVPGWVMITLVSGP